MEHEQHKEQRRSGFWHRNGHHRSIADWTRIVSVLLTILIATLGAFFFLGNRLESPEEKRTRIDRMLKPIQVELHRFEVHRQKGGHAVMDARVSAIESRLNSLDAVEREETEILRELTEAVSQYVEHQMRRERAWPSDAP